jgi:glycosyltransferase involved in cell wall biosynthesis
MVQTKTVTGSESVLDPDVRISIVVPSFNQARYLDATLRSLVEQEYPDKEIIVMDGGSTDGSVEVIRKYEPHLAVWRSEADEGQSSAIKNGFDLATGQVIGWVNSDDLLTAGALGRLAATVRRAGTPDAVFYGGWEVIDEHGQVQEVCFRLRTPLWIARALGPAICQPGTFFGRAAYQRVGGLDAKLRYSMDLDLWMRFVVSGVPFFSVPGIQAQFRTHSLQKGHTTEWINHCIAEEVLMQERYGLAAEGSLRQLFARQTQRALKLVTGAPYRTLAFRVLQRHRFRRFNVEISG